MKLVNSTSLYGQWEEDLMDSFWTNLQLLSINIVIIIEYFGIISFKLRYKITWFNLFAHQKLI